MSPTAAQLSPTPSCCPITPCCHIVMTPYCCMLSTDWHDVSQAVTLVRCHTEAHCSRAGPRPLTHSLRSRHWGPLSTPCSTFDNFPLDLLRVEGGLIPQSTSPPSRDSLAYPTTMLNPRLCVSFPLMSRLEAAQGKVASGHHQVTISSSFLEGMGQLKRGRESEPFQDP